ncbi:Putative 4-hydroxybenzoyl CoA thioesterase [Rubellimicrobium mesophilum DSM 19309]|uniref:Putative 4-hydroxybenzoyl CoA thioesterase n=1 Tax=Rubellimicrobium mesophilum DSM 19309 TaxID=442562 RepID=A0A017HR75_9RHOB|nr:acyl-CoA thioesterase [Rubellimicrobium mesophilum]EYD76982.1 Putative 4-hydroxybenzoyl CoA thioesterase [Rubellimicrobium mesophilum DSM 19309]
MIYRRKVPIEFNHCDPAGIVFYPRYFEMTNSMVENFFREVMDYPFARMMSEGVGTPTVKIEMEFRAPSRLGEVLDWALIVRRIGRTSARLRVSAHGGTELRLNGDLTLVFASLTGKALPWPDSIWSRLETIRQREPNEPA